ncbi:MAG: hypothetical protein RIQ59_206 [Bacteroidota bacterium]|jgi:hypothetical protein
MGYKLTAKKKLISWRYENKNIEAGETFVIEGNNLNGHYLKQAIEKAKGVKLSSSISSTPSQNDWLIEKF